MNANTERRMHPRFPIRCKTAVILRQGRLRKILHGHTEDVSMGGASICCDYHTVEKEATILLFIADFTMALDRHIELSAKILHLFALPDASGYCLKISFANASSSLSDFLSSTHH